MFRLLILLAIAFHVTGIMQFCSSEDPSNCRQVSPPPRNSQRVLPDAIDTFYNQFELENEDLSSVDVLGDIQVPNSWEGKIRSVRFVRLPHVRKVGPRFLGRLSQMGVKRIEFSDLQLEELKIPYGLQLDTFTLYDNKKLSNLVFQLEGERPTEIGELILGGNALKSLEIPRQILGNIRRLSVANDWNCDCDLQRTVQLYIETSDKWDTQMCRTPSSFAGRRWGSDLDLCGPVSQEPPTPTQPAWEPPRVTDAPESPAPDTWVPPPDIRPLPDVEIPEKPDVVSDNGEPDGHPAPGLQPGNIGAEGGPPGTLPVQNGTWPPKATNLLGSDPTFSDNVKNSGAEIRGHRQYESSCHRGDLTAFLLSIIQLL